MNQLSWTASALRLAADAHIAKFDSIAHRHTARHNTVSTLANHPILFRNKLLSVLNMVRECVSIDKIQYYGAGDKDKCRPERQMFQVLNIFLLLYFKCC